MRANSVFFSSLGAYRRSVIDRAVTSAIPSCHGRRWGTYRQEEVPADDGLESVRRGWGGR